MLIILFILFSWTLSCWFTQLEQEPFLGLPFLSMDVAVPFWILVITSIIFAAVTISRMVRQKDQWLIEFWKRHRREIGMVAVILFFFLVSQWISTDLYRATNNSDSAMYGVASYHIAEGKTRPMWFYDKHYNGTVSPHLAALFNTVFGNDPRHLRLANTLQYAAFILFLYLTVRLIASRKDALWSAIIAALPAYFIHTFINNTYFASVMFFGSWGFWLLIRALKRERGRWQDFFWIGAVFGLGFWAHLQLIFFIGAGVLIMLISGKRFLLKPAPWAAVPGFILGNIPTWIDSYYHDWIIFRVFFGQATRPGSMFSRFTTGFGEFIDNLGTLFAGKLIFGEETWLGVFVHYFDILIVFTAMIVCLWLAARELKPLLKGRDAQPGVFVFIVFTLVTIFLYSLSKESTPPSPPRYIAPVWFGVVPLIAVAALRTIKGKAAHIVLGLFAFALLLSQAIFIDHHLYRERVLADWEQFCRDNEISRYYGDYWITYNGNFFTREEIIGSCVIDFFEAYPPYFREVAADPGPTWYHFKYVAAPYENLIDRLEQFDIAYREVESPYGFWVTGFDKPAGELEFFGLPLGTMTGSVHISNTQAKSSGGKDVYLFEAEITNTGEEDWLPGRPHGYLELQIHDTEGRLLRSAYLHETVRPGEQAAVQFMLTGEEMKLSPRMSVTVNNIPISEPALLTISEDTPGSETASIEIDPASDLTPRQELFATGWLTMAQPKGGIFKIMHGGSSTLLVPIDTVRDRSLKLAARPFPQVSELPVKLQVYFNDKAIGAAAEIAELERIIIDIPAELQHEGINWLEFRTEGGELWYERDPISGEFILNNRRRSLIVHWLRVENGLSNTEIDGKRR